MSPHTTDPKLPSPSLSVPALRWPAPALLAWGIAWIVLLGSREFGWAPQLGLTLALLAPLALAVLVRTWPRRVLALAGFPVSLLLVTIAAGAGSWIWLLGLAALLVAYPLRAWRDAPFFPTPAGALLALREEITLADSPRVLDAGCGAGHGLRALAAAWPQARCEGVEWSRPLAWLARLRCPQATLRRGDMWADHWGAFDLVYVFQRPETMARAYAKAHDEMRPGTWLVSLEFEVPGVAPTLTRPTPSGKPVHAWCIVHGAAPQSGRTGADNPSRPRRNRRAARSPHA